jgi:hypothetical protein
MKKLILIGVLTLVSCTAQAGLSTGPKGRTSVTEAHAEAHAQVAPRRHKPVTFEKQLERSFKRAFSF